MYYVPLGHVTVGGSGLPGDVRRRLVLLGRIAHLVSLVPDVSAAHRDVFAPPTRRRSSFVVVPGLEDHKVCVEDLVDEAMLLGDAARPCAADAVLERFRFSYPFGRIT